MDCDAVVCCGSSQQVCQSRAGEKELLLIHPTLCLPSLLFLPFVLLPVFVSSLLSPPQTVFLFIPFSTRFCFSHSPHSFTSALLLFVFLLYVFTSIFPSMLQWVFHYRPRFITPLFHLPALMYTSSFFSPLLFLFLIIYFFSSLGGEGKNGKTLLQRYGRNGQE